jgi:hypothetical protein
MISPAGARAVVDRKLLPQRLADALRNHARHDVGARGRRKADDDFHRFYRIGGRRLRVSGHAQRRRGNGGKAYRWELYVRHRSFLRINSLRIGVRLECLT